MVKIAVIGLLGNSVFLQTDHFHQKGETLVADGVFEEIGGKGINQAVAAARMGARVSFLGAVGNDTAAQACAELAKREGITAFLCKKPEKRTSFAFILTDKTGANQVTVYRGAELCQEDVLQFEQQIAESDILLLQHEVPCPVNELAVQLAKKHGVRVILNPAPIREISDEMAAAVYAVTPNEQERQGLNLSRFQNSITTLGEQGCCINEDILLPALSVQAVDTTGAGDTFNGVLAVCIAQGMELPEACKYAIAASGISVSRKHVLEAIPYREEIERSMHTHE